MTSVYVRLLILVVTLGVINFTSVARAASVVDADFLVAVLAPDGTTEVWRTTDVPLSPDRVCYKWLLRLDTTEKLVKLREVFTLPGKPVVWDGVDGDDYTSTSLSADRTVADTTKFYAPKDGWVSNEWCVVPGDPAGPYVIDVLLADNMLHEFNFRLVPVGD